MLEVLMAVEVAVAGGTATVVRDEPRSRIPSHVIAGEKVGVLVLRLWAIARG
jgi:hypothetical protein